MDVKPNVNLRNHAPLIVLGLGLALIGASAFYILRDLSSRDEPLSAVPVEIDEPAPDLSLTDIGGVSHSLAEYRGLVVLVNLWATWCEPCKKEMPVFQAFHDTYAKEGFSVIAINDGDPTGEVLQFVKDFNLTFPVWLDPTYTATEQAFKTMNLPTSYVMDRNGRIRLYWVGAIDRKGLERSVPPVIREQP